MKTENKQRLCLALHNAAEMIRGHAEVGLSPEDVAEKEESGVYEYAKACERAAKMITTLANKYRL